MQLAKYPYPGKKVKIVFVSNGLCYSEGVHVHR